MGEEKIEVTGRERDMLKRVLGDYLATMRDRKAPPKGLTYGEVQDALTDSQNLLAKLG